MYLTLREILHFLGLWQNNQANGLIFPAQIHTCCSPTFSTHGPESFQVIFLPSLEEDGKTLPMAPRLPAQLVEGGHVRVPAGGAPSDAGLPALGSQSKLPQAPAAAKSHALPSQQRGRMLPSRGWPG